MTVAASRMTPGLRNPSDSAGYVNGPEDSAASGSRPCQSRQIAKASIDYHNHGRVRSELPNFASGASEADVDPAMCSAPAGEDRYTITKVITNAKRELARTVS